MSRRLPELEAMIFDELGVGWSRTPSLELDHLVLAVEDSAARTMTHD